MIHFWDHLLDSPPVVSLAMSIQPSFFARFVELTAGTLSSADTDPPHAAQRVLDCYALADAGEQERLLHEAIALGEVDVKRLVKTHLDLPQGSLLARALASLFGSLCTLDRNDHKRPEAITKLF